MLVLKIPQGEHVTIYDKLDGASPPITILITPQGSVGIEADYDRFGIRRSNAKNTTPKERGGKDARPKSA